MSTVKERTEEGIENQLILAVRDLIRSMNLASDLNIVIVEEGTSGTSFEFLLEYPPYEDSPQKFQRRVSNIDSVEFINNVFDNIEDLMGFKYKRSGSFIKATRHNGISSRSFADTSNTNIFKIVSHKKIRIRILFVEDR